MKFSVQDIRRDDSAFSTRCHYFIAPFPSIFIEQQAVLASIMNTSYALLALGVGVLSIFLLLMVITMGIRSYQRDGLTAGKKKKI